MLIQETASIVAGAASGLDAATANALASGGATVFGFDLPAAVDNAPAVDGIYDIPVDVTDAC